MSALSHRRLVVLSVLLALGLGCSKSSEPSDDSGKDPVAQTKFASADAYAGQEGGKSSGENAADGAGAPTLGGGDSGGEARSVAEGDIYRVLDAGTILNLNSYRGLQVIDVQNPDEPAVIGRLTLVGSPVEMYVRGDRAFVLLNDWQGYYGSRKDVAVTHRQGGLLVAVDLSNPKAPKQLDSVFVDGSILKSRLVSNSSVAALYVASTGYDAKKGSSTTTVTSFDVAGDSLARKTELDLGGYVRDIQATPDTLLVASSDWTTSMLKSSVAVVDISDPSGEMSLGDQVTTAGEVQSQFNMDVYNGVLRVVSTSWNGENQVETFDVGDLKNITPIDSCRFGDGQQLFATLFLQNKAFFVTYLRQDPFHAFEIADDGTCLEHNEFVVSGWNDFFTPAFGGTRLVGVGTDDADSTRTPAVSLYDITSLANPDPLLARATAGAFQWSWSEAASDHRAFSVLEGVVSAKAADGSEETGLVLLPYSGYVPGKDKDDYGHYDVGVALFTFSDHTVTRRANVAHDSDVRRSFLASDGVAANLSDTSLALFDPSHPDDPEPLGRVDLAPDYGRILRFGDYIARLRRPSYDYGNTSQPLLASVEIVAADADLDDAEAIASFEVPADAQLLKVGELLVATQQILIAAGTGNNGDLGRYLTIVHVHDLGDPTKPRKAGTAKTEDLVPTYFGYREYYGGGFGGPWGMVECGTGMGWFDGSQADGMFALGDTLVFMDARGEQERIGKEHVCSHWARGNDNCYDAGCKDNVEGSVECKSLDGGPELCTEQLVLCDYGANGERTCEEVAREEVDDQLTENCWDHDLIRYWSRYSFKPLDLSNPDAPRFGDLLPQPREHEGVAVLPQGDSLYYTYRVPTDAGDDGRPLVRYYFRKFTFEDGEVASLDAPVNVPGELLAVNGDRVYTKDLIWTDDRAETFVHALRVSGGEATLEHSHGFVGREVSSVIAEDGSVFVVHAPVVDRRAWSSATTGVPEQVVKLTALAQDGLTMLGETRLDDYASLEAVHEGRALFTVPGGLLMANVEDPSHPYAQAFFYSNGWPEQILFEGDEILIAAGRFGIERFQADATNLLSE